MHEIDAGGREELNLAVRLGARILPSGGLSTIWVPTHVHGQDGMKRTGGWNCTFSMGV